MKLNLPVILVIILVAFANSATATNIWSTAAVIHDTLDGLLYTGTEFAAYRRSPNLRIYTSEDGINWTMHNSALNPLSVGHDGHGYFYAFTRTSEESGNPGWHYYTAHIWRSADAENWQYLGAPLKYIEILPASAYFSGSDSHLLVKFYTIWGSGWVTGPSPSPLFIANRTNPASFSHVPSGNDIEGIQWTGSRFVATSNKWTGTNNMVITSLNGTDWSPLFDLGNVSPPNHILSTWRSLFFISGFTIENGVTEAVPFNTPVPFYDWRPLVAFSHNGNAFVLAGTNASYVSTNYSQSWLSNQMTSVRGVACNGTDFLMGDQSGTNLVVYKYTPTTNIVSEFKPLRMNLQPFETVDYFVTNTFVGAVLYPSETNSAGSLVQLEVSCDLQEWILHGLPTTNTPVVIDIDHIDSPAAFFRMQEVKWE